MIVRELSTRSDLSSSSFFEARRDMTSKPQSLPPTHLFLSEEEDRANVHGALKECDHLEIQVVWVPWLPVDAWFILSPIDAIGSS